MNMGEKATQLLGTLTEFSASTCEWSIYKKRLTNYFLANDIEDDKKKRAILLNILGEDTYKLVYNLLFPKAPEETVFHLLVSTLDEHFQSAQSVLAARFKFYNAKKAEEESVREWAARVCSLASACEFGNEIQIVLRDIFIVGFTKGPIQDSLMEKGKEAKFKDIVAMATTKMAAAESISVKMEPGIHHVSRTSQLRHQTTRHHQSGPSTSFRERGMRRPGEDCKKCYVCGKQNPSKTIWQTGVIIRM